MSARHLPAGLGRRPLVVASLGDAARLESDARRAVKEGADVIEVRADLFGRAQCKPQALRALLRAARGAARRKILLTVRRGEEGGGLSKKFREQDRLALIRAALSEVDGVDIELGADDINSHVVFEAHKRKKFVLLSAHDFKRTPNNATLARWLTKARRLGGGRRQSGVPRDAGRRRGTADGLLPEREFSTEGVRPHGAPGAGRPGGRVSVRVVDDLRLRPQAAGPGPVARQRAGGGVASSRTKISSAPPRTKNGKRDKVAARSPQTWDAAPNTKGPAIAVNFATTP